MLILGVLFSMGAPPMIYVWRADLFVAGHSLAANNRIDEFFSLGPAACL